MRQPGAPSRNELDLSGLSRIPIRVAVSPLVSVSTVLYAAARPERPGETRVVRSVREALPKAAGGVLIPAIDRDGGWDIPDCLHPVADRPKSTFADELDELASTTPEQLVGQLVDDTGDVPNSWRHVERGPSAFLTSYIGILRGVWEILEPVWRNGTDAMEREVERIAVAVAHDTLPELLVRAMSLRAYPAELSGDMLKLPMLRVPSPRVSPDGLVLVPLVGRSEGRIRAFRDPGDGSLTHLGWALKRSAWLDPAGRSRSPRGLEALLGAHRATILRLLDRSRTAGNIAAMTGLGPSGVTPHLDHLQAVGLVRRRREGRNVVVERTTRGSTLLDLYPPE